MNRIAWAVVLALGTVVAAPRVALAQSVQPGQRAATAQGLLAQADLARVRERRLADDREVALIAGYEQRIGGLQRQIADWQRRTGQAQGLTSQEQQARRRAEADLAAVRGELATLAETTARRDAEWAAERAAYRTEMEGMVAEATPEKLAALDKFADGDRVGAWPVLRELTEASVRARMAAAGMRAAVEMRQLAEQRAIMRANGEANAADVLAIWEEAARLDPQNFSTHFETAALNIEIRDLAGAQLAIDAMRDTAKTDSQVAIAADSLAGLSLLKGDFARAATLFEGSLQLWRSLAEQDPSNPGMRRNLWLGTTRLGDLQFEMGEPRRAAQHYGESLALIRQLQELVPGNPQLRIDLVTSLQSLAKAEREIGETEQAIEHNRESLDLVRGLIEAGNAGRDLQRMLSIAHFQLGQGHTARGELDEAERSMGESLRLNRALAASDPANGLARQDVASVLVELGEILLAKSQPVDALAAFTESASILRTLASANPDNAEAQDSLAVALGWLGKAQADQGELAAAIDIQREVLALRLGLAARQEPVSNANRLLRDSHFRLGDLIAASGDAAGAAQSYAAGLTLGRAMVTGDPVPQVDLERLVRYLGKSADIAVANSDWQAALNMLEERQTALQRLRRIDPGQAEYLREHTVGQTKIGDLYLAQGNSRAALTAYEQGLPLFEQAAAQTNASLRSRADLVIIRFKLGEAHKAAGQPAAALEHFRAALLVAQALAAENADSTGIQRLVAATQGQIAALEPAPEPAAQ